jgi:hypothetical protein
VKRVRRDVVLRGTLTAGMEARRGRGLLRGSGLPEEPGAPAAGVRAAAPGVLVVGVEARRVQVRVAEGAGTLRPAGKGAGRPVRGLPSLGAVRAPGQPESGLIGPAGSPIAEKGRRGSGGGLRVAPAGKGVGRPVRGRTGRGGLRTAEGRGTGPQASGGAGTQTLAREATGRAMRVREGLGALGRTTMALARIAAPRGHDGGLKGMRAVR